MPTTKRKAKPGSKRTAPKAHKKKTPMKVATESRHPLNLPRNAAETAAIEKLRRICLALPEATEKIAWGEPTWRAGTSRAGKMFAQMETHHHGPDHVAVWLPARPGVQEALVEEDPERYFRPPYVGHKGWIAIRIDRKPDWATVAQLVAEAYRLVAAPDLVRRLDAGRDEGKRGWRADWIGRDLDPGA
jgi:predicted DNA-binding protein (MmcQ/YjbR family)